MSRRAPAGECGESTTTSPGLPLGLPTARGWSSTRPSRVVGSTRSKPMKAIFRRSSSVEARRRRCWTSPGESTCPTSAPDSRAAPPAVGPRRGSVQDPERDYRPLVGRELPWAGLPTPVAGGLRQALPWLAVIGRASASQLASPLRCLVSGRRGLRAECLDVSFPAPRPPALGALQQLAAPDRHVRRSLGRR